MPGSKQFQIDGGASGRKQKAEGRRQKATADLSTATRYRFVEGEVRATRAGLRPAPTDSKVARAGRFFGAASAEDITVQMGYAERGALPRWDVNRAIENLKFQIDAKEE